MFKVDRIILCLTYDISFNIIAPDQIISSAILT
jgi:hypothetical protein